MSGKHDATYTHYAGRMFKLLKLKKKTSSQKSVVSFMNTIKLRHTHQLQVNRYVHIKAYSFFSW